MVFDPNGAAAILAIVLTAPGVVIVGALVAAITEALKSASAVASHPKAAAAIISALVILYAAWATGFVFNPANGFGLFLLWLADNGFAKASYDTVKATVSNGGGEG